MNEPQTKVPDVRDALRAVTDAYGAKAEYLGRPLGDALARLYEAVEATTPQHLWREDGTTFCGLADSPELHVTLHHHTFVEADAHPTCSLCHRRFAHETANRWETLQALHHSLRERIHELTDMSWSERSNASEHFGVSANGVKTVYNDLLVRISETVDAAIPELVTALDIDEAPQLDRVAGDLYVLLEGGLVQNNPVLPVLDLDVLSDEFVDLGTLVDMDSLRDRAYRLGLHKVVARVDAALAQYRLLYRVDFDDGDCLVVHTKDRRRVVERSTSAESDRAIRDVRLYGLCEERDCPECRAEDERTAS